MCRVSFPLAAVVAILLMQTGDLLRADEKEASSSAADMVYPANVAMSEEPNGLVFRHFPSGLRLYVYDKDSPGKSVCNAGCESAWPPLLARPDSKPMGDWTLVTRHDGQKQWAYKGRPVYMRFHDDPNKPGGDGMDGVWHLLGHFTK